jgi:predicted amino acid racemase
VKAIITKDPSQRPTASVEIPATSAIDYYGMIDTTGSVKPEPGDSVVFGFRGQAFVKRSFVAGVSGVTSGNPQVTTIENSFGQPENWPNLR